MTMVTGKDELDSYVNLILQQKKFGLALLIDTERLLFHRTPMQSIKQQCHIPATNLLSFMHDMSSPQ